MTKKITPDAFQYLPLPALRFIGIDAWQTKEEWSVLWRRKYEFLPQLDAMRGKISREIPHICALMHHDDGEIDVVNRFLVGRFFLADTPVPPGFDYHDLAPQTAAYAVFDNTTYDSLWQRYEAARDAILNDGVFIPYPVGYWHAEVYLDKTPFAPGDPPFRCGVLFACNK